MSTITAPVAVREDRRGARFSDVLRSEWTKVRSVPSTMWTIAAALIVGIGLSLLISAITAHAYAGGKADAVRDWDPTAMSTSGGALAQLAIAVLGTLVITSEYATRSIRVSLAAVPRRGHLLAGKAVVVSAVALAVGEFMAFVSFLAGQAIISGKAPTASLSDPTVFRAVAGAGVYCAAIALLGMALGALLRSTAGAITGLVAMLYVLPGLVQALPSGFRDPITKFWPTIAGTNITNVVQDPKMLGPWAGMVVMLTFVGAVLAVANWRLTSKDA
jgi:ABC-type transport system involved in multi-copper enzyme maturation permease subunit